MSQFGITSSVTSNYLKTITNFCKSSTELFSKYGTANIQAVNTKKLNFQTSFFRLLLCSIVSYYRGKYEVLKSEWFSCINWRRLEKQLARSVWLAIKIFQNEYQPNIMTPAQKYWSQSKEKNANTALPHSLTSHKKAHVLDGVLAELKVSDRNEWTGLLTWVKATIKNSIDLHSQKAEARDLVLQHRKMALFLVTRIML